MTLVNVMFGLLSVVAVAAALAVVSTRRIVHAALWLVVVLGALAGCYLLLAAEFVAWVQVLIYVGAVVVLLLFALMLTRAPTGSTPDLTTGNRWVAAAVSFALAVGLVTVIVLGFGGAVIDLERPAVGRAGEIGDVLFRNWVLPFEILSVLLLAALIGAITLSRAESSRRR